MSCCFSAWAWGLAGGSIMIIMPQRSECWRKYCSSIKVSPFLDPSLQGKRTAFSARARDWPEDWTACTSWIWRSTLTCWEPTAYPSVPVPVFDWGFLQRWHWKCSAYTDVTYLFQHNMPQLVTTDHSQVQQRNQYVHELEQDLWSIAFSSRLPTFLVAFMLAQERQRMIQEQANVECVMYSKCNHRHSHIAAMTARHNVSRLVAWSTN